MNKSKIFMIISIIVLCLAVIGVTLAYYVGTLFNDLSVNTITHGLDYYINYSKGQVINTGTLNTSHDYTGGASAEVSFYKVDETYDIYGHIYLDITSIGEYLSSSEALKYTLVNINTETNTTNVLSEGSLKGNSTGSSVLTKSNIPLSTSEQIYRVYIWLDESETIDSNITNETLSLMVRCEATMKPIATPAIKFITDLYNEASKTEVTNNNITYNYAKIFDTDAEDTSSGGLMNDRLGTMSVGANAGNIRYYGANPNNYIDIGDVYEEDTIINHYEENAWFLNTIGITSQNACLSAVNCQTLIGMGYFENEAMCRAGLISMVGTYETQGICGTETIPAGTRKSLYRIIGLFKDVELSDGTKKDLIKVIRNDTIGAYSWDQSASDINEGKGINEWSQADLMKLLNPGYNSETVGGSLYWNSARGTCYGYDLANERYTSIPCDFTHKGLSANARNKIETVKWNLGGHETAGVYPNEIYQFEKADNVFTHGTVCYRDICDDTVTRTTTWSGKVALVHPSDYGYASSLDSCSEVLYNYRNSCVETNWMYQRLTFAGDVNSWLLNPLSDGAFYVWSVYYYGQTNFDTSTYMNLAVLPSFYLNADVAIASGDGSKENPYVVK